MNENTPINQTEDEAVTALREIAAIQAALREQIQELSADITAAGQNIPFSPEVLADAVKDGYAVLRYIHERQVDLRNKLEDFIEALCKTDSAKTIKKGMRP